MRLLKLFENLLNGSRVDFAISVINAASNSRLTNEVTFIASINETEKFGKSMNNLSIGEVQFLSVIHAIVSQALHSGGKRCQKLFRKQKTFEINLRSCSIA